MWKEMFESLLKKGSGEDIFACKLKRYCFRFRYNRGNCYFSEVVQSKEAGIQPKENEEVSSTSSRGRNIKKRAFSREKDEESLPKKKKIKRGSGSGPSEWIQELGLASLPSISDESRLEGLFALESGAKSKSEEDKRNKIRIALSLSESIADYFSTAFWAQDLIAKFVSTYTASDKLY